MSIAPRYALYLFQKRELMWETSPLKTKIPYPG